MVDTPQSKTVSAAARFFAIVLGVLMCMQSAMWIYIASGHVSIGTIGLFLSDRCAPDRYCAVDRLSPAGPAAQAGIGMGDAVRMDRYWERYRRPSPGESVGMTIRNAQGERRVSLSAVSYTRPFNAPTMLGAGAALVIILTALLMLARAGRQRWVWLLGLALTGYGGVSAYPVFWENERHLYVPFMTLLWLVSNAAPALMLSALRGFRREITGDTPAWLDWLVRATWIGELLCLAWGLAAVFDGRPVLGMPYGTLLMSLAGAAGGLLAPLALAFAGSRVPPPDRTRYAFMWLAASVLSLLAIVDPLSMWVGQMRWPFLLQVASLVMGAILFAYATLRHRLVDLGFVVSRTIVFSALSFVLLLLFGLIEWLSEKLLPEESHQASAVIDAVIALGVFLIFHRLHDWMKHRVEQLFFHQWKLKARQLALFVHESSYITRAGILADRAVAELSRYAGQAEVALYRRRHDAFVLQAASHGRFPERMDVDEAPLVKLRAERRLMHDAFAPGDLLLPMTLRAEVTAFVIVGAKPGGQPYRVDEQNELAVAVDQLGLNLYALRVDELENEVTRLRVAAPVALG